MKWWEKEGPVGVVPEEEGLVVGGRTCPEPWDVPYCC